MASRIRMLLYGGLAVVCSSGFVLAQVEKMRPPQTASVPLRVTSSPKKLKDKDKAVIAKNIVRRTYSGPVRYPDFKNRDQFYADFRTRITNGMRGGPNFAGRYALITIGCGTGCRSVYVADVSTGRVFAFPLGGEDNIYLNLSFTHNSRAVIAYWQNPEENQCIRTELIWKNDRFRKLDDVVVGAQKICSQLNY